jgi:hypothetical protein
VHVIRSRSARAAAAVVAGLALSLSAVGCTSAPPAVSPSQAVESTSSQESTAGGTPVEQSSDADLQATGTWRPAANSTSGTIDVVVDDEGWVTLQLRGFTTDAAPTFGGVYAALMVDTIEEGSTCFSPSSALASPEIQTTGDQDVGLGPLEHLPPVDGLDSYVTAAIYTVPEKVEDREPGCDGYTLAGYAPLEWTRS